MHVGPNLGDPTQAWPIQDFLSLLIEMIGEI